MPTQNISRVTFEACRNMDVIF